MSSPAVDAPSEPNGTGPSPSSSALSSASLHSSAGASTAASSSSVSSSAGVIVAPVAHEPTYFESQQWSRCALHTINNLLQRRAFTRGDLDALCESLTPRRWFNPHRSLLPGMGNYDVNVLMAALGQHRLALRWYDRRRSFDSCNFASLYGLILNVPSRSFGALGARHWYAVKRFPNGDWYAMDSDAPGDRAKAKIHAGKKPTPAEQATKIEHLVAYLTAVMQPHLAAPASKAGVQLFLVEPDPDATAPAPTPTPTPSDANPLAHD